MSKEISLDIGIVSVTPQKDGSAERVEYIKVADFDLYHRTKGGQLEYKGGSTEFINYAGCNRCPVKDSLCKPSELQGYVGRKVTYNSEAHGYFPCQQKYDEE